MRIKNHQFYMTVDGEGLKFVPCDLVDKTSPSSEFRLLELNKLGYRFIAAVPVRHRETDISVVIAIFEQKMEK